MLLSVGNIGVVGAAARRRGVGLNLSAFMAAQADGFYFDVDALTSTWQDTAATTPADDVGEAIGRINDLRVGTGSPHNGLQSTAANRPTRQSGGVQFDNSNDNWLTDYVAGSGDNFVAFTVDVPTSLSGTQYVCGASSGGTSVQFGFNLSGTVRANIGTVTYGAPTVASPDNRQQTVTVIFSWNTNTLRIWVDGVLVQEAALTGGGANTSAAWRVGASNTSGSASGFFGGKQRKRFLAGRQFLITAEARDITRAINAPATVGNIFYTEGDSYVSGSGGAALVDELRAAPLQCVNRATSGSTIYQQRDRIIAESRFRDLVLVHWDGSPTGYVSVNDYMGAYAAIAACIPSGKFIFLPPVKRTGQSTQERDDTTLIQAAVASTYPNNYIDAQAIMVGLAVSPGDDASVAAGCVPASTLQGDGLHPTVAAEQAVAAAVIAMRTSKGW